MLLLANSIKAGLLCPFFVHSQEGEEHKRVDKSISLSGSPLFPGASCLGCAREKCYRSLFSCIFTHFLHTYKAVSIAHRNLF